MVEKNMDADVNTEADAGYYADLTVDMPFKKTFANEKDKEPLIVMLNVFLAKKLAYSIVDVDIKNPYVPGETIKDRGAIFDIRCEDSQGSKFLVEVQVGKQAYFIKRVLFYACMAITKSGKKGKWDFNYPAVYSLSFLSFDLDFGNDDIVQYLSLSNDNYPKIRYGYINLVFVRLGKFHKSEGECKTLQDRLMFSLRNAHRLREKPSEFNEEVFDKIFDIARISNFTLEERDSYEAAMKNERDRYAALKYAKEEGWEAGREEGFGRGVKEGATKLLTLLESGVSLPEAKRQLGLS
ncbi:MAG: Rpn family recombination-promoting nuclease/putative transposase [Fibromonadaceae bacterium]|jgi:predicted transposase/invertase (TIGR01784 family)|nr:Rpn family recombination-promoting nuclease/putative transposase [Fibromonadaceae bacterium]